MPYPGQKKGGPSIGLSPVDRSRPGSKHHVTFDGRGGPLAIMATSANVNDIRVGPAVEETVPAVARRPDDLDAAQILYWLTKATMHDLSAV
ncbi:transposase [Haloglycomyces albus]|uniref:transposase n=1 Tax=Haloglycomyces albus TaxID=526067 RepID=UPI003CCBA2D1